MVKVTAKVKATTMSLALVVFCCVLQQVDGNCGGLQGDVVFVLDASGSVGSSNFQTVLSFVNNLVDDFDIGSNDVRVGVVKYASSVTTEIYLSDHSDKSSLKTSIASIVYTSGGTNTADAISQMTTSLFTTANGDRTSIPDIGIIITDGQSWSLTNTAAAAAVARALSITLFSIGIGTGVTELNAIATDPDADHVFTISGFSGLSSIESAFQTKACTSTVFAGNLTVTNTTETGETTSDSAAAIAGGVTAGVAALGMGVAGAVIYSKVMAGQTAVSSLQSTTQAPVNNGPESQNIEQPRAEEPDNPIPGMIDAPANIQPMDTRWPARLPPLRL